jgi:hypothetical protein
VTSASSTAYSGGADAPAGKGAVSEDIGSIFKGAAL